jgi:hypothetical protein
MAIITKTKSIYYEAIYRFFIRFYFLFLHEDQYNQIPQWIVYH